MVIWNQSCGTHINHNLCILTIRWKTINRLVLNYHRHENTDVLTGFHFPCLLFLGVWLGYRLQRLRGDRQRRLAIRSWFSSVGFPSKTTCCVIWFKLSCPSLIYLYFPVILPFSSPSVHSGHIMAIKRWRTLCVVGDGPGTIKSNTGIFSVSIIFVHQVHSGQRVHLTFAVLIVWIAF